MDDLAQRQGRNVLAMKNADFLCLFSMTGRGLLCVDPRVPYEELSPLADEEIVGDAVRALLSKSSILDSGKLNPLIKSGAVQQRQEAWAAEMSQKFSYTSKREMFRNVLQIDIRDAENFIRISPTRHYELNSWGGLPKTENIVIPSDSSTKEIGRSVFEAFSRCTNELAA